MKISKITIKSLFGIKEWSGDGKNIELVGDNGTGKTSVIDAIRYALTNASDREYIIKNGETEGEIFIETDSGLSIDRKPRQGMTDYKSVKQNGNVVPSPETFLKTIFTPLQLSPMEFISMDNLVRGVMSEQTTKFAKLMEKKFGFTTSEEPLGTGKNFADILAKILSGGGRR